jgi:hypothetical protein
MVSAYARVCAMRDMVACVTRTEIYVYRFEYASNADQSMHYNVMDIISADKASAVDFQHF